MTLPVTAEVEHAIRSAAPQALGVLVRRYGGFDACEDAVQEALLAASQQWPRDGVPDNPTGWLVRVAARRWVETARGEIARRRREQAAAALAPPEPAPVPGTDDTLALLLMCCHPSLNPISQVALTLRAVGGLTTAEIARALLVPVSTVGQRISRAKQRIRAHGAEFRMPPPDELPQRMVSVRHVLYLIFNEGHTASSGPALQRVELAREAIRLTRQLRRLAPGDGEVAGLLALMLLTDARRPARAGPDGQLIPLAEQDRRRWDRAAIAEGVALISNTLPHAALGPFQVQAAIAAVHDEAARAEDTDWPQVLGLYDVLDRLAPGPMVTLNRIVALAMVHGARIGLERLAAAEHDPALAEHHRLEAVRAHLLDLAGEHEAARDHYRRAARRTLSLPERQYLAARAGGRSRSRRDHDRVGAARASRAQGPDVEVAP